MGEMVSLEEIKVAANYLKSKVIRTPCLFSPALTERAGVDIYLKLENFQLTGAFKVRGNLNKMRMLSDKEREKGVVTASTGNHGQGMALAARFAGIPAVVVVPEVAPRTKIEAIRYNGGEVIIFGRTYDDAYERAMCLATERKMTYIPSFDDEFIIAGQGTIGLEIMEDLPIVGKILCPVGGGGLISGVSIAVKALCPNVQIIGIQSERAASMVNSLEASQILELSEASTIADGIAVRKPGRKTYEIVKRTVDGTILVSDLEIKDAIRFMATACKVIVEGAGATPIASLLSGKFKNAFGDDGPVVCVVSGGNIDRTLLTDILCY